MKRLIVITGDLASGKSTIADIISERLNILAIKKDTIKENLCDTIGFSNREENKKLSVAAVNSMIEIFKSSIKAGNDLILEANFHKDELIALKDLADNNGYKFIGINLYGDIDFLFERFCLRAKTRHPAHMSMKLNEDINRFKEYIYSLRKDSKGFDFNSIDVSKISSDKLIELCINIIEDKVIYAQY